jgi:hypothetical protein
LLVFKYARQSDFFKAHYREMLIFAEENVPEEILMHLFLITLFYIQTVSNITKKEQSATQ